MKFLRSDKIGGAWYEYFDQISKEILHCHVMSNGFKYYWKSENTIGRHRKDGAAIEGSKYKEWWVDGKLIGCSYDGLTEEMFSKYIKLQSFW